MLMNNPINNAFSIQEFCDSHRISRAKFYLLLKENLAPKLMHVGRRRLISNEAATEWRRQMEVDSEATQAICEAPTAVAPVAVDARSSVSNDSKKCSHSANGNKLLGKAEHD